jgi:hypothetical protein
VRSSVTRRWWSLVAALMSAQLVPSFQSPALAVTPPSVVPESGVLLGAAVGNRDGFTHYESVLNFEEQIGRQLAISQTFRKWDNQYWGEEAEHLAAGRIPMITWGDWGKTPAKEIASGSQDAIIRDKADAIKALEGPVFLRWGAEPAGGKYGTAEEYIAAWKRIRKLFAEQGATNVMWVWCPTAWAVKTGAAQEYYPGDGQVDWIAANGFNFYPAAGPWKTFHQIFEGFYKWASKRGKPLMIGGTAAMEDPDNPSAKAKWIRDIVGSLKQFPKIKAFNYFHAHSPKGYDFWADTSEASMDAFVDLAQDPYVNGEPSSSGSPARCTIVGTQGDDVLRGTMGRDAICGLGGDDLLKGFGGRDVLYGGRGNDVLKGFGGKDILLGSVGKDVLRGGSGRDRMSGKGRNDRLSGGGGPDKQFGGTGHDRMTGGAGSDRQAGGKGWDRCYQGVGAGPQASCEAGK